ncbi:uncharacterized protein TM35_000113040 [Trypanosoma theileri]|uniref:Uncharacterized protein n=1 Tax=Trypanosoma theileri TaxID=67003 RepID=A0A1X0P033_9TRYP|nr:uncharacterized protein TM35_000113040 [Trypanosoma theileri]ORC89770.1 hypothetical protein TM35_000113040 [Trypanosoma theileri]
MTVMMMTRRVFCLLTLLLSVACVSAVVEGTTAQPSQTTVLGTAAASLGQSSQSPQTSGPVPGAAGLRQNTDPHGVGQPGVPVPPLGTSHSPGALPPQTVFPGSGSVSAHPATGLIPPSLIPP